MKQFLTIDKDIFLHLDSRSQELTIEVAIVFDLNVANHLRFWLQENEKKLVDLPVSNPFFNVETPPHAFRGSGNEESSQRTT